MTDSDTAHVIEQREHQNTDWRFVDAFETADEAADALLDYAPPVRVVEYDADDVDVDPNDTADAEICGAETVDGGQCQNPAGSCSVASHD